MLYPEEDSTVNKVRREKLLARKTISCKINHLLISFLIPKQAELNANKSILVD